MTITQWLRTTKNPDVITGPPARPFAYLLARSAALICSFARSHAHSACGKMNDSMSQNDLVFGQRPRRGRCPMQQRGFCAYVRTYVRTYVRPPIKLQGHIARPLGPQARSLGPPASLLKPPARPLMPPARPLWPQARLLWPPARL